MRDPIVSRAHEERVLGALVGLAIGDAIGLPAELHRSVRNTWARGALWRLSAELDEERVSRPMVPFSNDPAQVRPLCPTDDTESAVAAAVVLTHARSEGEVFESWLGLMSGGDVWAGVAERNAVKNAAKGLQPPATGSDNPARHDDSGVVPGVIAGLLHPGDPAAAAHAARQYAQITHADDGVWAAQAAAAVTAVLASGDGAVVAVAAGTEQVPADSWTGRNLRTAHRIATESADRYEAILALRNVLDRRIYSFGGVAAETLPLALAILTITHGTAPMEAILLANSLPRKSDSLPAIVGALSGCVGGVAALPATWRAQLDHVDGLLIPGTRGMTLTDTAAMLVAARA